MPDGESHVTVGAGMLVKNLDPASFPAAFHPAGLRITTRFPITKVILDGVVFSDGIFVGPDNEQLFSRLAMRVSVTADIASRLLNAQNKVPMWAQLRSDANPPHTEAETSLGFARRSASSSLVNALDRQGESAALELAARYAALPALRKQ